MHCLKSRNSTPVRRCGLCAAVALAGACATPESTPDEVAFVLPGTLVANAEYASRRARLMDAFPDGVTLVPGATGSLHEGPLRQNNDFF